LTSRPFDSDDFLLGELRAAHEESLEVPPEAVAAAKGSFTWRMIDSDLETLALCFDSAVDDLALVRTAAAPLRTLSFESDALDVELELNTDEVTGQLIPAYRGQVRMISAAGPSTQTSTDPNGCFVLKSIPQGPFRIEFVSPEASFATEWVAR
jgi:hypothetical protein